MKKILNWNPEFAKNLWLEFSLQRLVAMPAIILVIVILIFSNSSYEEYAWQIIHYTSLSGFIIVGLLWGIKNASDSVLDEYNEKTWDWQKMSNIGSWKLVIGKLFGSTLYNWYGALIFWILFMISVNKNHNPEVEYKTGILMIIAMLALHGLMILFALQMIRKTDGRKKIKSNRIFIAGIIFILFMMKFPVFSYLLEANSIHLSWYSIATNIIDVSIISAVFYGAWIIAGLYRSMRAELQYSDTPVWWTFFIFSNFLFQYGFFSGNTNLSGAENLISCLILLFIETITLAYILFLIESKDIVNFRLLIQSFNQKDYNSFFKNIPLWLTTFPIAVIFGIFGLLLISFSTANIGLTSVFRNFQIHETSEIISLFIASIGYIIRDFGILLLINFSSRSKRTDAAAIIYLILMYSVAPVLTHNLDIGVFFYPSLKTGKLILVLLPLLEAATVMLLLNRRWKEIGNSTTIET